MVTRKNRDSSATVSRSRIVAARTLSEIEEKQQRQGDEIFNEFVIQEQLDDRDRGLAFSLVYTVLRNRMLLDYQYRGFLTRPPSRLSSGMRALFRLAVAQRFYFERLPDHAIANDNAEIGRRIFRMAA